MYAILTVATLLPWLSYMFQGNIGLSLWDEGFLWYGAQRVMMGEVPLLDFQAYDIGRYYWAAGIMSTLGSKGILALRISNAVLLSMSMLTAVYLIIRKIPKVSIFDFLLISISFIFWMTPDYKAADFFASIILIFALSYTIERPSNGRYFITGIVVGIAAILGRNHGVYGAAGSLGGIAYLTWRHAGPRPMKAVLSWGSGVIIGYLPMLLALALIPGFWGAFLTSLKVMVGNLALPVPRSWIVLPCFALICTGQLFTKRQTDDTQLNPVFVSSTLLMFPYIHYAFSRADPYHLAFGIFPLVIGCITFPVRISSRTRHILVILLFLVSIRAMLPLQPFRSNWSQKVTVIGDTLKVSTSTVTMVSLLTSLSTQYAANGRYFLAAPFMPGAYAVLGQKSPVFEIYALLPRNELFQQTEISRIKSADIGFAIINDTILDGRKDLLYASTHPLMERYVRESFQPLKEVGIPPKIRVFLNARANGGIDLKK